MKRNFVLIFIGFFIQMTLFAQNEANKLLIKNAPKYSDDYKINPLAPAKAAFYSTVLPGLGQAYNKKYWMIPVIYGAMGTSLYFYKRNDDAYNRFLSAYKLELAGKPHEFDNFDISAIE